ncbi:hypothetical protein [Paludibacterium yongneupense]|uniref:hypothetical protein n=1 Tax=Paludibacterium yongneupense TaxID=400061 RepID=UPI00040BD116|nr:hypothetical protein [Paludibacterium yongneupense]
MSGNVERPRIAVLVSPAVHPVSGRACAGAADLAALALGQALVASGAPDVFYAGAAPDSALADYLAHGCRRLLVLRHEPDQDVSASLAAAVRPYDLVICGIRSGGGMSSGLLPYQLAELLGRPLLPGLAELSLDSGTVRGAQSLPQGEQRLLEAGFPVLASVHPRAATARPWRFAGLAQGRIEVTPATGCGLTECAFEPERRALPLRAARAERGHERMLQAIAAGDGQAAGLVVNQGDSVEKAQVVLDYLRHHQLVDY